MPNITEHLTHLLFRRRSIDETTGCWEWTGTRPNGYGVVNISAHRLAAMLWLHLDPAEQHNVCHKCANRACFNPDHLYLGDARDNARDRARQGRGRENAQSGRDNPNNKLTETDVREIRQLVAEGYSQEEVAAYAGIVQPHVSRIVRRIVWADLPDEPDGKPIRPLRKRKPRPINRGGSHPSSVMNDAQVRELRALAASGVKQKDLAAHFGISTAQTSNIVRRVRWGHLADLTPDEAMAARRAWDAR